MACNNTSSPYCNCQSTLLCLHSSTSSSKQWKHLLELLIARYNVATPDLYGYGDNPVWTDGRPWELTNEAARLERIINALPGPFHLIGHSYGGAVALQAAVTYRQHVQSLIVYEPVLFGLLIDKYSLAEGIEEVLSVEGYIREKVQEGDLMKAARRFIDYWSGGEVWQALPDWKKNAIAARVGKVVADFDATLYNNDYKRLLGSIKIPVLILYGQDSPLSTRQIAARLHELLPHSELQKIGRLGHLGPITHPNRVNKLIEDFLSIQPSKESTCKPGRADITFDDGEII